MGSLLWVSIFILPSTSFALDSLSFIRALGTNGDLGTELTLLVCVKSQCQVSVGIGSEVKNKKTISFSAASVFFKNAEKNMQAKAMRAGNAHAFTCALEYKNKKMTSDQSASALLQIENRLKAVARK